MKLFNYDLLLHLLALAGIYAIAMWLVENLKSPAQVLFNILKSLIIPQENKPLAEKYGKWAGEIIGPWLFFCLSVLLFMTLHDLLLSLTSNCSG